MPVVLIYQGPSLTRERYEQTIHKLTGKPRPDSLSDWSFDGLLLHVAGESPQGFRVIDVWQSEEAFNRFGEALAPLLKEAGIDERPEVYEAQTFVSG